MTVRACIRSPRHGRRARRAPRPSSRPTPPPTAARPRPHPPMPMRITRFMLRLQPNAVRDRLPRRRLAMLALPTLLVLASCSSDDGLGKRYPVSGTVTYNGQPLQDGEISFIPDDS